jgi:hypothetical protein
MATLYDKFGFDFVRDVAPVASLVWCRGLAILLRETNRPAEAEPFFRRALAIDEKRDGPDHPDVATRLSNRAIAMPP